MDERLFQFLSARLQEDLPGRDSQLKMAPTPISKEAKPRRLTPPKDAAKSSVLLLIFPDKKQQYELIITLRTNSINHGGQLSFPGGRAEVDEQPVITALREAREEIGVQPEAITVAGQLSTLYIAHSNNLVTPVIGLANQKPHLTLNPREVEEVFSVTLGALLQKKNLAREQWELPSAHTYNVPYWTVHRVPLWGATAMILSEFLELYKEFKSL